MSSPASFIIALVLLLSGVQTASAAACAAPEAPPTLRVEIDASNPVIDHNQARAQLKGFDIATVSPYGSEKNVHVNGLMRGAITIETQMGIAWQRSANGEDNCYWFNNVHINLKLNPTIYIAREIQPQSCLYNEVLRHEYKHFKVDLETSQDYQLVFQEEIQRFLQQSGVIGPFPSTMQEEAKKSLMQRLEAAVQSVNDRMKFDRLKRQSKVDTREEYDNVVNTCPGDRGMM